MDDPLRTQLKAHEGKRLHPYIDSTGHITIGYGRNITDVGIFEDEAQLMFENDIKRSIASLQSRLPWWVGLSEVRKMALIDLAFNLGIGGLLGFRKMLDALRDGRYDDAADELLDSKAATQAPARYGKLANMLRSGKDV